MINLYEEVTIGIVQRYYRYQSKLFEKSVRDNAKPTLKGDITRGKLKWRGIIVNQQLEAGTAYTWVEQRGKRISPKIRLNPLEDYDKLLEEL